MSTVLATEREAERLKHEARVRARTTLAEAPSTTTDALEAIIPLPTAPTRARGTIVPMAPTGPVTKASTLSAKGAAAAAAAHTRARNTTRADPSVAPPPDDAPFSGHGSFTPMPSDDLPVVTDPRILMEARHTVRVWSIHTKQARDLLHSLMCMVFVCVVYVHVHTRATLRQVRQEQRAARLAQKEQQLLEQQRAQAEKQAQQIKEEETRRRMQVDTTDWYGRFVSVTIVNRPI
jgi:hypothetical protein